MISVRVADESQVAQARRVAASAATAIGFDEVAAGQVAIVASELASNLVKHGGEGQLLVEAHDASIELLALDRGPGMHSVSDCLRDGYSTAGTLGHGLGAVRRLSRSFEIASSPGQGTAVYASVANSKATAPAANEGLGAVIVPKVGEEACGDAWASHEDEAGRTLFVVDGLGHGTEAALAAHEAVKLFQRSRQSSPSEILHAVHQGLRHTRGGAIAVARIHWGSGSVSFVGLGNIAAAAATPDGQLRRMVSHNGIAGHNARKIQAFEYPCADGVLVMHSDGLSTHWDLTRYAGLLRAHPMLIAGVLYRDHGRDRDDATVVVSRIRRP